MGVVIFKVNQEDMPILKQMIKDKSDNFYITLNANQTKSLLYSGKFKIFENIKFVDIPLSTVATVVTGTTIITTDTGSTTKVENMPPPQFDANGIPIISPNSRGQLDYYRNAIIYAKQNLTSQQLNELKIEIDAIGLVSYYRHNVFVAGRIKVENIQMLMRNAKVETVFQMKLDFGWFTKSNTNNLDIITTTSTALLDNIS
jgi:hypothetical protein